jgi:peptide/nickel transport system permease protein
MENSDRPSRALLLAASILPGVGHLMLGKRRRGVHLLLLTVGLALVLVLRWDAFVEALMSPRLASWLSARFLLAALATTALFSLYDVRRSLASHGEDYRGRSPFQVARRRFADNQLAVIALYVIVLMYLIAALAPILAPFDPAAIENPTETQYLAPSWQHLFGTDEFGRDLFSRALYGASVSLSIGLLAVLIAITIGTVYGSVAGFFGGLIDSVFMRVVDVVIAFPVFFLMLMLVGIFEANIVFLILILGLTSWTGTARFIRGEVLSIKEREFIEGASAIGLPSQLVIVRHIIPNAMAPVLVSAALMVGGMIAAEAGLSFLGIGIRPPTPSWGNMISQGQDALLVAWWVAFFPGALLVTTILAFNLLADGLRDALDPKTLMRKVV